MRDILHGGALGLDGFFTWIVAHSSCVFTTWVLLALDIGVMGVYVKKGFSPTMMKYYGGYKIAIHTIAALTLLGVACLAMSASMLTDLYGAYYDWETIQRVCEIIVGIAVVAAGCGSLALARFTSGLEGFNWAGYTLYTLLWIYTGLFLFTDPSTRHREPGDGSGVSVYECWVVSHAFLFCRIFTIGLKPLTVQLGGPKMVYAVGTSIATLVPLYIAYEERGAKGWLVSIVLCILVELSGLGDWIHVRGKKGRQQRNMLTKLATTPAGVNPHEGVNMGGVMCAAGSRYMETQELTEATDDEFAQEQAKYAAGAHYIAPITEASTTLLPQSWRDYFLPSSGYILVALFCLVLGAVSLGHLCLDPITLRHTFEPFYGPYIFDNALPKYLAFPRTVWWHIAPGLTFVTLLPFLMSTRIRRTWLQAHRVMGYTAYASGTIAAISSVPMLLGPAFGVTLVEAPAVIIFGGWFLYSASRSLRAIRAVPKDVLGHFRWNARMVSVVMGVAVMRPLWIIYRAKGSPGNVELVFALLFWVGFVVSTSAAEVYLMFTEPKLDADRLGEGKKNDLVGEGEKNDLSSPGSPNRGTGHRYQLRERRAK